MAETPMPQPWPPGAPEEIFPAEAAAAIASGNVAVIDCREPDEHAICRIEGATLIPLGEWHARYPAGFPAPGEPVIIYCHHGMRSHRATRFLRQRGHALARSLAGGIEAWSCMIDPSVPRY